MTTSIRSTFTVARGIEVQKAQIKSAFDALTNKMNREIAEGKSPANYPAIYIDLVNREIEQSGNWESGFDVPRGIQLEQHYFTAIGKTPEQYREYLSSMD